MAREAGQVASETKSKVQEAASNVAEKSREIASAAAQSTSEMASAAGRQAESAAGSVGSGMQSLANQLRQHGPDGGMIGSAKSAVADTLESGGRYLQEHGLKAMGDDVSELIRKHPVPALLVGIGLGFLIARSTRS
jgi:hypothetical protein